MSTQPKRVALKVQRRKYVSDGVFETFILIHIRNRTGPSEDIVHLHEAFLHDGHLCMAFEQHGSSLQRALDRKPLSLARTQAVTRQMLRALERMHRCGYTHTDVKPENILYRPRDGAARLADLGSADNRFRQGSHPGTREYMSPEILLGTPLAPSIDLWCLGCTVFEMLTGHVLFQPRKAARKKYREFSHGKDHLPVPLAETELRDQEIEKAEQMSRGEIVAEKYRLHRRLGGGGFATVWAADRISDRVLDGSYETLWGYAQEFDKSSPPRTEQEEADRQWQRTRGADDLLDLVLQYEHMLLIAALCGPVPPSMIEAARYRASYFEADGAFRFRPVIRPVSLRDRLRRRIPLRGSGLTLAAQFIQSLLAIDPASRPTIEQALGHPWLSI